MKQYEHNATKRLAWVARQYSKRPEVAVMTTEVVLYMLGYERSKQREDVRRAMDAIVLGDEDEMWMYLNSVWATLPEKHKHDPVIPWIAKQINDVMKAIDAHKEEMAVAVLEGLDDRREREWLNTIIDVLSGRAAAIAQWVERERVDLNRYTLQQVLDVLKEYEASGAGGIPQGEVVYRWIDGWTVQQLGAECLAAEGEVMQHCVGSGGYDEEVDEGRSVIYSLRDKSGKPHATMEVDAETLRFKQIQGKQNEPPKEEYLVRVREFIREAMGGDLLGLLMAGVKNALRGADLSGTNLRGADLSGTNLRGADLSGTNLSDADLSGSDLRNTDLRGANLNDTDLHNADLSGSDLRNTDLSGAYLRDANLSHTDLSGANLRDTNLSGSDLSHADLRGANLSHADLSYINLIGATLRNTDLSGADLRGANLIGSDLSHADLSNSDLSGANLEAANLNDTEFSGAIRPEGDLDVLKDGIVG